MIRVAKRRWNKVVLVCGKCSKKVGGGFGADGDERLAKLLRRRVGKGKHATAGVIETKCLKLCPKRAVCVVDADRPGAWLVVPPGAPLDEVAARLGLDSSTQLGLTLRRRRRLFPLPMEKGGSAEGAEE